MRRLAEALAVAVLTLGAAGCGQDEAGGGPLEAALGYMPEDATIVALSTDLDGEQLRAVDEKLVRRFAGRSLRSALKDVVEGEGGDISFEDDIEPLLGADLVLGLDVPATVAGGEGLLTQPHAAIEVEDAAALRDLFGKIPGLEEAGEAEGAQLYEAEGAAGAQFAIAGDVFVEAPDEKALRAALARGSEGGSDALERFEDGLADLPEDALIRVVADAGPVLDIRELERFRGIPWAAALRQVAVTAGFEGDELRLDTALSTDPEAITEDDLPLVTGDEPPGVVAREDEVVGGSVNQSQTTAFLLRGAREAFPDSRFVRDVARVERALDIDFEREVLRQFDGPSASALGLEGGFAARSEVSDPQGLARTIRRLAPDLGRLVQDLEALQSEGLSLLLLFAPDAPVSQGVLGASRVDVETLPGQRDFYRISALSGDGPDQLFFGLEKGVFVIGSSEERAKAIAREPAEPPEGARGASVTRADLDALRVELEEELGTDPGPLGELVGSLSATESRLRGSLRIDLP